MMSLRTDTTPFTLRASSSARSFSAADLAKPESCTTPFSVSTLIAIALTVLFINMLAGWLRSVSDPQQRFKKFGAKEA